MMSFMILYILYRLIKHWESKAKERKNLRKKVNESINIQVSDRYLSNFNYSAEGADNE